MKRPTDAFWNELARLDRELDTLSYYELLGVSSDVAMENLRRTYERQVRALHPDRHAREIDPERRKALTRIYARTSEAFSVLSHPKRRSDYDRTLMGEGSVRQSIHNHGPGPGHDGPSHPQAKSLLAQAKALLAKNDKRSARAKLSLAQQYAPESIAISRALEQCQDRSQQQSTPPPTPEPVLPASPIPEQDDFERIPSRVHKRAPLGQSIRVSCKSWEQVQSFYMHNISRGGMLLRCNQALPVGSIIELTIRTPTGDPIGLPAEVVRQVAPKEPGQRPGMGVKFIVIPDSVHAHFEVLLKSAGLASGRADSVPPADLAGPEEKAVVVARALIESGEYNSACLGLQEPVSQYPDNKVLRATFHLAAGMMARQRGQAVAAHSHFERALRYDSDSPLILRLLREDAR